VLPQLVAIDGPLKGAIYTISTERFSIGRKPENTLAQADLSISATIAPSIARAIASASPITIARTARL